MNVKFLSILLLLAGGALSATLQLGTVRRPPASAVKRIARPGGGFPARRGAMARSLNGEDGEEGEEEKQYPGLFDEDEEEEAEGLSPPPTPDSPDEALAKLNFETQEVQDAVGFIEFKMNEMNVLIQQCIDEQFEIDVMADVKVVKHECVGTTFQVLFFSYREGLRKLKDILLELLKIKLQQLDDIYEDEANFFIDLLNELIDMFPEGSRRAFAGDNCRSLFKIDPSVRCNTPVGANA